MSQILLLDLGNTRLKWAVVLASQLPTDHYILTGSWSVDGLLPCDLENAWAQLPLQAAYLSTVGQHAVVSVCERVLQQQHRLPMKNLRTLQTCAGLHNSYVRIQDLGVDRWLGMLAAHYYSSGASINISLGTATTIDVVDTTGQHLGGYIVPGVVTMQNSLGMATADGNIKQTVTRLSKELGQSTHHCINNGIVKAHVAIIESVYRQYQHIQPSLFLSGGVACHIQPFLSIDYQLELQQIFHGMQIQIQQRDG